MKAAWNGHILWRNYFLKHVIEENIEETRCWGGRCKQLVDDVRQKASNLELEKEGLDRTLWWTDFGPLLRQIAKWYVPCPVGLSTFTAIVDLSRFNNSCLKSPASTLVDLTCQPRALRSFSLNQLRNLSL